VIFDINQSAHSTVAKPGWAHIAWPTSTAETFPGTAATHVFPAGNHRIEAKGDSSHGQMLGGGTETA
jgi:hypothetical protein